MSKRPRAEDVSKRCDNCGSLASDGGQGGLAKMESTIRSAVLNAAASIFRKGRSHCRQS